MSTDKSASSPASSEASAVQNGSDMIDTIQNDIDTIKKECTVTAQDGHSKSDPENLVEFGMEPGDIIIVSDHKRFSCHKSVLVKHSQYFRAMFQSGMKESRAREVRLDTLDSDQLQGLLDFFYMGRLDLTEANVRDMTELSCHLQVAEVQDRCCSMLLDMVEDDLCLSLMRLAYSLMLPEVYNISRRHALWHFPTVCQTEDFTAAPMTQVVDYLQDPHLNLEDELEAVRAAAVWYCAQEHLPWTHVDMHDFFGKVANFRQVVVSEVADLAEVKESPALSAFVESLSNQEVLDAMQAKFPMRNRTSPRNGRILCVGGHQCNAGECEPNHCILVTPNQKTHNAPLDVLGFDPDQVSLQKMASLSEQYPAMALDAGYRVCAVGHKIYVVGGDASMGHVGGWLTAIWCLDTFSWTWQQAGLLTTVRRHHGLCAKGSTLYLIGGIGKYRLRLSCCESFDTETRSWRKHPDMLHQEIAPVATTHRDSIYVFKNYAQILHIPTDTWAYLRLLTPVPGLPIQAQSHPTENGILISCFNSESLWFVNLDRQETEQVARFEKEGGAGILCKGKFYHFQIHEPGRVSSTSVECYDVATKSQAILGVMEQTVITSHLLTVPLFPTYAPSTSSTLS